MGFKISWDTADIERQLMRMSGELNNPLNDGFSAWAIKKDLLEIEFLLHELISKSYTFGDTESNFINELEKKKTWKILNDKTSNN